MYKQCQTERSIARQRELEQGLLRIMFRKHYDEITVSDLCTALSVPRKAFYRYFSGKDGALHSLIDHTLMDFDINAVLVEEKHVDAFDHMLRTFSYWKGQKLLLDALAKSGISGLLVQRALEYSRELDTIPEFMQITDRSLRDYGTMFTVCGLMSMIVRWHNDGFVKTAEEMAQLSIQLFSVPLFSCE